MAFSGRPAGRPVPAPLRERAPPPPGGLPRRAARASPLRTPGPRAWTRVCAPRARGAAAGALRSGARPATRRPALGPWTGTASLLLLLATSTVRGARGRAGPAASAGAPRRRRGVLRLGARPAPRRSALGPWTGTVSPLLPLATHNVRRVRGPAGPAAPARRNPRCGDGRGTCPALPGLRQAGPSPRGGAEGGRVPPSRLPAWRSWCGSPSP
jgi:hypothetical protein